MNIARDGSGMKAIGIDALQEGDILLMMGDGPLSDLIAWASDGVYSHAGIVVDGGELVEASLGGVRRYPLARRATEHAHFHFIDAWRPQDPDARPFAAAELALVRDRAGEMLGAPYPVDQLALFGAIMAVRGKWPLQPLLRKLVRIALDHAVPSTSPAMVCSEVVYRAWAECAVDPRGRLAPPMVEGERGTAPFPDIDWKRLATEIGPLLFPGAAGDRLRTGAPDAGRLLETGDVPTDEALDQARQRVLADLDAPGLLRTGGQAERLAHRPNPRLVSPQDLANSPGTRLLGRLMGEGV